DLGADAVLAAVDWEPEGEVGVDGVVPRILEAIGPQLVPESDSPAFVATEIDDHAPTLLGDAGQRSVELWPTVAAERTEDVAGEALAVHPHQHRLLACDLPLHEGHVLGVVDQRPVGVGLEGAPLG